ncbi:MAG: YggT family protein [Chloroflexi bacterium]|jgi:YggT family protein|nr:YggT family protein [Chloroflexota bacterium]MDA1240603.1 YggT family protein [Chloroflexota bacterium]MQC19251.1 YggT family protein [Chloroflexota bacterium]
MEAVVLLVAYLVQFLAFSIFARAILTWLPIDKDGPVVRALNSITDPILDPLRRVIPPIGMIDLTPMIAMIALFFIANMLFSY